MSYSISFIAKCVREFDSKMKQIYHNTDSDFTKDLQNYHIDKKARERADEWIKWRDEKIKEYQQ